MKLTNAGKDDRPAYGPRGVIRPLGVAVIAILVTLVPVDVSSATALPSTISSNTTLTSTGSPYTGGTVTVASGVTLTVDPGVTVKVSTLTVNGTLDVNGTGANPAVFTSSSNSAPGQWNGITLTNSGSSNLDHAEVRYAKTAIQVSGASPSITNSFLHDNWAAIKSTSASPQITDNEVADNHGSFKTIEFTGGGSPVIANNEISGNGDFGPSSSYALSYIASGTQSGQPSIHDNTFSDNNANPISASTATAPIVFQALSDNTITDNNGVAIAYSGDRVPPDIDENTVTGNSSNTVRVGGTLRDSTTWEDRGFPFYLPSEDLAVASGTTLTLDQGMSFRGHAATSAGSLNVNGTLITTGTAADPIVFTSSKDTSVGGAIYGSGSGAPAAGDWEGITLTNSGSSSLGHAEIRYAKTGVQVSGGSPSITSSFLHDNWAAVKSTAASPQITDNEIADNHGSFKTIEITGGGSPLVAYNEISGNGDFGPSSSYALSYIASGTQSGQPSIHDNTFSENNANAISVSTSTAPVQLQALSDNTITDNNGVAIAYSGDRVPPDIDENTVTGNSSNTVRVGGTLRDSTTWEERDFPFYLPGSEGLTVASGTTLTLDHGVSFRGHAATYAGSLNVKGTLLANGTAADPIVFTSSKDESVGGPIYGSGNGALAAGDWNGILFTANSQGGSLEHVSLRYAKTGVGITCPCPTPPETRHSKFEDTWTGFQVAGNPGATPSGRPLVSDSTFRRNSTYAIDKTVVGAIPTPRNNYDDCESGPGPAGCGGKTRNVDPVPWDTAGDQPCAGGKHQCGSGMDPVSLATGELTYSHTDLQLTNRGAMPLEFTRAYSSGDRTDSGLGAGWSHSGFMRVTELEDGDVRVRYFDGRRVTFDETATGYEAPSAIHDVLTKQAGGAFRLKTLERSVYDFRADGRIDLITDDHGNTLDFAYNSSGRLSSVSDSSGQSLTFTYNASNHLTRVADSAGRETSFSYTNANELATVTDALGEVTTYGYTADHQLHTVEDGRGVTYLTNAYDSAGRVSDQWDGLDNHWTVEYDPSSTTVTDPEGGETTTTFDAQGRVETETDPLGRLSTYSYDGAGNIESVTRPGGAVSTMDYDSDGNLVGATYPEGGTTTFTHDSLDRLTSRTDPRGKTWTYEWSAANDLVEITDPDLETTEFDYDSAGRPTSVTDENGHQTILGYDARGNLTSREDPLGNTTSYGYDAYNQPTSTTEPGKAPMMMTRSALGDLLTQTTPEGHTTEYGYDEIGNLISVTDPALETWTVERNAMERPTAYVDPLGKRTEIAYDENLNPVSVTDRRGFEATYAYDLSNQLTEVDRPATGDWLIGYDARGNRDEVTDPRGNTTTYEFDLNDRMTDSHEPLAVDTSYSYDADGNLTSFTDPRGNTTSFAYDDVGRMTQMTQPQSKLTNYSYDPGGNLIERATAVDTLTFTHDDADRLIEIAEGTNVLRAFAYDPAGRLTEATDGQQDTIELDYDDDDNLVALDDGRGQTSARTFDSRGNLTQQGDGRGTISYVYDELNRMTQLTDPQSEVIDFGYDEDGNLTETVLPNGVTTMNTWDGAERMATTEAIKGTTTLQSFDYVYDAAGNRTSQVDRNSDETTYEYDALNRLTEFDPPAGAAVSYAFDKAGNRTQAGSTTFAYDSLNQLTSDSTGATYDYDDAGHLTEIDHGSEVITNDFDALGQLIGVARTGHATVTYSYDALGRRADRAEGTQTESAHYGDTSDLATIDTQASTVDRSYIQGANGLVEERAQAATTFPLPDAIGHLPTDSDDTGAVTSRREWDPWGAQISGPSAPMGWFGAYQRRYDAALGLTQMGVRTYSAEAGSFASEDPLIGFQGLSQTMNRTAYAVGNPIAQSDLSGYSILGDLEDMVGSSLDFWDDHGLGGIPEIATGLPDQISAAGSWYGDRYQDLEKFLSNWSFEELAAMLITNGVLAEICTGSSAAAIPAKFIPQLRVTCMAAGGVAVIGDVGDVLDEDGVPEVPFGP
ncbi:MAG: hypothetical protein QOI31_1776 [Solirubrobacterales bacterium]|jgi:RHS repeat-associated protein|nr:hypothetical protein [Solirubrobacterales bacterium]